jgi:hypothetical protein
VKKSVTNAANASPASTRPVVVIPDEVVRDAAPVICGLCGGPARLCGGVGYCIGGPTGDAERRWLVAIRVAYAGLLLTRTPAALWGGALLRFARQLARGPIPTTLTHLVLDYADPCCALAPTQAAGLVLSYLKCGDLAALRELEPLREGQAPWLVVLCALGRRAARATPLDRKTFGLVAVVCDRCVARGRADPALSQLVRHVGTYDEAIQCPTCGEVLPHPLPRVEIGKPHPISRCVGPGDRGCLTHRGGQLDADGLCAEGRAVYDQTVTEVALTARSRTARNGDLLDVLSGARQRWQGASEPLLAAFTEVAKAYPRTARALAQLYLASINTKDAGGKPTDDLISCPELSQVLDAVESAAELGFKTFVDELAGISTSAGRRRS